MTKLSEANHHPRKTKESKDNIPILQHERQSKMMTGNNDIGESNKYNLHLEHISPDIWQIIKYQMNLFKKFEAEVTF